MELNPRLLAFLEHEMSEIMNDEDRAGEDRHMASTLLGRIEAEIERAEQNPVESASI